MSDRSTQQTRESATNVALFDRIESMAISMLPSGAVAVCSSTNGDPDALYPDERLSVARAVEKRRAEFAAGRSAARMALKRLGQPEACIPVGSARQPLWPDAVAGSISHCRSAVIAIAMLRTYQRAEIGIDIEEAEPLASELWEAVCTPRERQWLSQQPSAELAAKIVFAIKEAVYKAQFPITGRMLDFQDVEIDFIGTGGGFEARIRFEHALHVYGCFRQDGDYILSYANCS